MGRVRVKELCLVIVHCLRFVINGELGHLQCNDLLVVVDLYGICKCVMYLVDCSWGGCSSSWQCGECIGSVRH